MTSYVVRADNLCLDYPIYSMSARSIRSAVAQMTIGGQLFKSRSEIVVVRALDQVNFTLSEGDRLAVVGFNGSGKSTLLRVLAGVYAPTAGEITVKGRIASMLDISHGMDPEATGVDNIRYLAAMRGISPFRLKGQIDEIIEFSGLGSFIDMPVRSYSSGMAARLLFSVATAFEHDVLLLEEWLSAGDSGFIDKASARMRELVDSAKVIVTATHSMDLAKSFCNKVLRLNHGSVIYFGPIDEYDHNAYH